MKTYRSLLLVLSLCLLAGGSSLRAQDSEIPADSTKTEKKKDKKAGLPLKPGRTLELETTEGSWLSLDVSPDGKSILFDMLGDIYQIPITGGKAERVTRGLAYDTHPKFSPDGKYIAYTSDIDGNENVWIKELASGDSTQITKEKTDYIQSAEWTPDGQYLVVSHGRRNLKVSMYHKDGGGGIQLIKEPDNAKFIEPAFGPDGRYLWLSRRNSDWQYNAQLPQYQLTVFDRETGEMERQTNRYGSAFAPTLSLDGKWLVYGTRYNTETGLIKRNLETGEEDWLAYPVQRDEQESRARLGVYPAMSFTPDSKNLIASYGGKIWKLPINGGEAEAIPFSVKETLDLDTKTIKMYMAGNRQHRQWIIEAAKEQGLMPTTEGALDFKLNMTQVMDGYPGHEHAFPIYPLYKDVLDLMVTTRTAYTPTLLVAYGGPWAENYYYATEPVQSDKKLNHFTPKAELDAKSRRRPGWFMEEEHIFQRHAEFAKELVEAGGIVGVGSHGQLQGLGYHWELWSVQSGGMSNHDALKVATILGAEAIGLSKDLGSLESGKLADLIILNENPLEDIRNTNSIQMVMKNGRLYDGDTLDEVYPRQRKAPELEWSSGAPEGVPGIRR